jgi:D-xylose transport system substrate-binding protein
MSVLKPLTAAGKGNVAVILPDTVSSARYTQFDAPYLTQALTKAGLSSSQFTVQNAQGSDATELSDAQTAITKGASVLIMDPLDSGVGAQIESYAKAHGVGVVDYDRLTLGGSRAYYVSFNNVLVGTKIGQGFTSCAAAWHVAKPNVLVMKGAPTTTTPPCSPRATTRCSPRSSPAGSTSRSARPPEPGTRRRR